MVPGKDGRMGCRIPSPASEEAEHVVPKCTCVVPKHWPQMRSQQGGWDQ